MVMLIDGDFTAGGTGVVPTGIAIQFRLSEKIGTAFPADSKSSGAESGIDGRNTCLNIVVTPDHFQAGVATFLNFGASRGFGIPHDRGSSGADILVCLADRNVCPTAHPRSSILGFAQRRHVLVQGSRPDVSLVRDPEHIVSIQDA